MEKKEYPNINLVNSFNEFPLYYAYKLKDFDMMVVLLNNGADINGKLDNNTTLLMKSIIENNLEMFNFLIKNGANIHEVNKFNKTALSYALEKNNVEMIKILLNLNATDNNFEDLSSTHNTNNVDTIELNNLSISDSKPEIDIVNQKDENGITPLIHAVNSNNLQIILALLENGANVNECDGNGNSPIIHAICKNRQIYNNNLKSSKISKYNCQTVELLLKYGANLDDINIEERFELLLNSTISGGDKDAHLVRILAKHNKK